jgi:hypothetical protein
MEIEITAIASQKLARSSRGRGRLLNRWLMVSSITFYFPACDRDFWVSMGVTFISYNSKSTNGTLFKFADGRYWVKKLGGNIFLCITPDTREIRFR